MVLYYYHPYVSGVSVMAKELAEQLSKRGYEVTILTSQFESSLPREEQINGVRVIRRPVLFKLGKGVIMPTFWIDIIRYSWNNDYVNAHLPMPDVGLSALFIPKRKLITTYQCDINLIGGFVDRIILFISYILMHVQMRRSAAILTTSTDYFDHSKMKRYSHKAIAAYPPITASEYKKVNARHFTDKLHLSDSQIKIGFIGRIVYEKGIKYLLMSIPYLSKKIPDFKIVIVGDYERIAGGGVKDELDHYMKQYPDRIIFTGYLSDADKKRFLSTIDVLVLPSIDPLEAFGIVQIEAMLCGSPVVASDMPGVREVVRKTGYGLTSNVRDPEDIAKKIIKVVQNRASYAPDHNEVARIFNPEATIETYARLMSE